MSTRFLWSRKEFRKNRMILNPGGTSVPACHTQTSYFSLDSTDYSECTTTEGCAYPGSLDSNGLRASETLRIRVGQAFLLVTPRNHVFAVDTIDCSECTTTEGCSHPVSLKENENLDGQHCPESWNQGHHGFMSCEDHACDNILYTLASMPSSGGHTHGYVLNSGHLLIGLFWM